MHVGTVGDPALSNASPLVRRRRRRDPLPGSGLHYICIDERLTRIWGGVGAAFVDYQIPRYRHQAGPL